YQQIIEWVPSLGIRYHVAVDGVSMWLILLCTFSTPVALYVSFNSIKTRVKDLCFAFLMLHGAMLGCFVALDLFLFFTFSELKLGTYGYIRFCMGMLGGPAFAAGANLAGIAIGGGIIYGALVAWKQDDVKRLVAYSSVAHMGFVMLGCFAATQAGLEGAILQM